MKKIGILIFIVTMVFSAALVQAEWQPNRPITLIVPWAAGGATDQTCRVLAGEMEKVLGQKIPVVNQPGGAGSIGMKNAFEAKHDGYTWTGNADGSVITYQVLDLLPNISHRDWIHYYAMLTAPVICVPYDSKIMTVDDLVAEFKARPGEVKVASAGVGAGVMCLCSCSAGCAFRTGSGWPPCAGTGRAPCLPQAAASCPASACTSS